MDYMIPFNRLQNFSVSIGLLILISVNLSFAAEIDFSREGAPNFSYEMLIARAALVAQEPFVSSNEIEDLPILTPDVWSAIRFRQGNMPWNHGSHQSEIQLDYPVSFFPSRARVFWVDHGHVEEIKFDNELFEGVPDPVKASSSKHRGFSGIQYLEKSSSLSNTGKTWLMFLGDNSFRSRTNRGPYGSFALPLEASLQSPHREDITPKFTEFYLESSDTPDSPDVLYAVIEGTALAGVYRFSTIKSNEGVIQDIEASLFVRRTLENIDLIPLVTSFAFGEVDKVWQTDIRPEVHDADGLLLHEDDEGWIWRPLALQNAKLTTVFRTDHLKGFGLLQRDRDPEHYLDASRPQQVPNIWVEPIEPFGDGEIRLVENGTDPLYSENIHVAFRPKLLSQPGSAIHLHFKIHWGESEASPQELFRCKTLYVGRLSERSGKKLPDTYRFRIEYAGQPAAPFDLNAIAITAASSKGTILRKHLFQTNDHHQWIVELDLKLPAGEQTELELKLEKKGMAVAEGWRYAFKATP